MEGTIEKNVRLSKSSKQRESERGLFFLEIWEKVRENGRKLEKMGESQRKLDKLRENFIN